MESSWVTYFDVRNKLVTILRTNPINSHWAFTKIDEKISSPHGEFTVFIDPETKEDIKFEIRLNKHLEPSDYHSEFNFHFFGSPTLWTGNYNPLNEGSLGGSYIWWIDSTSSPWKSVRPEEWYSHSEEHL